MASDIASIEPDAQRKWALRTTGKLSVDSKILDFRHRVSPGIYILYSNFILFQGKFILTQILPNGKYGFLNLGK